MERDIHKKRKVVLNTTPLIALLDIGMLHILKEMYAVLESSEGKPEHYIRK